MATRQRPDALAKIVHPDEVARDLPLPVDAQPNDERELQHLRSVQFIEGEDDAEGIDADEPTIDVTLEEDEAVDRDPIDEPEQVISREDDYDDEDDIGRT
ncbi:MAG: hypothetical protein AB7F09_19720 [Parvibaculaceae bacterium]